MESGGEGEDQVLACLGDIGRWQWRNILITGLFCAPSVWHIMIITFMNAEVVSVSLTSAVFSSLS